MTLAQILALAIFVIMFVMIVLDKIERQYVTLGCGLLTLVLVFGAAMRSMSAIIETLNLRSIFTVGFWYAGAAGEESSSGINWATIIFIAGMMIMVEGMAKAGFFPLALYEISKARTLQTNPAFCCIYDHVIHTCNVY